MQSRPENGNYYVRLDNIHNYLAINGSVISEYYRNENGDAILIECDIGNNTFKVYLNGEDILAVYSEFIIEDDIVDIDSYGTRFEGQSIGHVPCGFGFLYDADNNLVYKGFFFDTEKVCFGKEYYSSGGVEYIGFFYNSMKHCYGVSYDRCGNFIYEGYWRCNLAMNDIVRYYDLNGSFHSSAEYLSINGVGYFCDDFMVINYPRLKSLRIAYGGLCLKKIFIIQNCRRLEEVFVSGYSVYRSSMVRIADCPRLETLYFLYSCLYVRGCRLDLPNLRSIYSDHSFNSDSKWKEEDFCLREASTGKYSQLVWKDLPSLTSLTAYDSFNYFSTVWISNVPNIQSFKHQCSFYSFSTAKHVLNNAGVLTTHPSFKHEKVIKSLERIPFRIVNLIFNQIYKPSREIKTLRISHLPNLKTITFCTFCVPDTSFILISHCNRLQWVEAASRPYFIKTNNRQEGELEIRECKELKRLIFKDSSFSSFRKFTTRDLPSLETLYIGFNCFAKENHPHRELVLMNLPKLESLFIYGWTLIAMERIVAINLPNLGSVEVPKYEQFVNKKQVQQRKLVAENCGALENCLSRWIQGDDLFIPSTLKLITQRVTFLDVHSYCK